MENLEKTSAYLCDLIDFHVERIAGYQEMIDGLAADEKHLHPLFEAFVKQSDLMKSQLLKTADSLGLNEIRLNESGKFGMVWSVVKVIFASKMPQYPLERCKSGENALLVAYHGVESGVGIPDLLRTLIRSQKMEVIEARGWIAHFDHLQQPDGGGALTAVS